MWNQTVELDLPSYIFVGRCSLMKKVLCEVGGSWHMESLWSASTPFVLLFRFHLEGF